MTKESTIFPILRCLADEGAQTQRGLAEKLGISENALRLRLRKLPNYKLVATRFNTPYRSTSASNAIAITGIGRQALAENTLAPEIELHDVLDSELVRVGLGSYVSMVHGEYSDAVANFEQPGKNNALFTERSIAYNTALELLAFMPDYPHEGDNPYAMEIIETYNLGVEDGMEIGYTRAVEDASYSY
jgi:predicted ArsR family transcriptional regulator